VQLDVLVLFQVVDGVVVLVQLRNVLRDVCDVFNPEVVHIHVDVCQDHVQPLFQRTFAEQVKFRLTILDDFINFTLHQVLVGVVDDFLHDVRVIRIVFLAFVFFDP
jgi:hypothetical protein